MPSDLLEAVLWIAVNLPSDVVAPALVCKQWAALLSSDALWQRLATGNFAIVRVMMAKSWQACLSQLSTKSWKSITRDHARLLRCDDTGPSEDERSSHRGALGAIHRHKTTTRLHEYVFHVALCYYGAVVGQWTGSFDNLENMGFYDEAMRDPGEPVPPEVFEATSMRLWTDATAPMKDFDLPVRSSDPEEDWDHLALHVYVGYGLRTTKLFRTTLVESFSFESETVLRLPERSSARLRRSTAEPAGDSFVMSPCLLCRDEFQPMDDGTESNLWTREVRVALNLDYFPPDDSPIDPVYGIRAASEHEALAVMELIMRGVS